MADLLRNPDRALADGDTRFFKNGYGSTVGRIRIDDRDFVVKRYNIKGLWHALKRCSRATRAARSWRYAHRLLAQDIFTPRPVALLEKRFGPFRSTAYYINEYLEGPRAIDFFQSRGAAPKDAVAGRIVWMINRLKEKRISHGDMKATNIIIHGLEPALVDLDAMRAYGSQRRFGAAHQKDVKRFMKNWADFPEVRELFAHMIQTPDETP
jgi:tRNA A-37 threonylcarbamoyl transferase component Bud32